MDGQPQRVKLYVAIGTDLYDGLLTLQWTLSKWSNHRITSIVILYAANGVNKQYIMTPLAAFHASYVNEEKLKMLEKIEEAKNDKMLSQFVDFCGKVKAEVIKLGTDEEVPLHHKIVEMVSSHKITRLVMSLEFMKTASSWKPGTAIAGAFYVLANKPHFCEFFVIREGRLVFIRRENAAVMMENDRGVMIAKLKEKNRSIKNWLGKRLYENGINNNDNQWEKYAHDIEQYVNELLSQEEIHENDGIEASHELENVASEEGGEGIQILQNRIRAAQDMAQFHKNKAVDAEKRQEKANWAISICNSRVEELEACINNEITIKNNLNNELNKLKEEIDELKREVEEKRNTLSSILGLQTGLLNKFHLSSSSKALAEAVLHKEEGKRVDILQRIEDLRKHRDVLQLRIEFRKEKDGPLNDSSNYFREFPAMEIARATDNFSQHLRLQVGGDQKNVCKGKINEITVAIKMHGYENNVHESRDAFARKVRLLGQLKHPHLLAMIGFCTEPCCIVYEYMHNGNLHDALLLHGRSWNRTVQKSLSWYSRIRIAAEICSALGFLHKTKPKPLAHANITPFKILLDSNDIVKIGGLNYPCADDEEPDIKPDILAFGSIILQLLLGKNWIERINMDTVIRSLDDSAGEWPVDLATQLCGIALRCLNGDCEAMPVVEIQGIKKCADQLVAECENDMNEEEESMDVPSAFLCPIYQDVMQNPYVAADG